MATQPHVLASLGRAPEEKSRSRVLVVAKGDSGREFPKGRLFWKAGSGSLPLVVDGDFALIRPT